MAERVHPIELSEDAILALTNAAEPRLHDLDFLGCGEIFVGEHEGLRDAIARLRRIIDRAADRDRGR